MTTTTSPVKTSLPGTFTQRGSTTVNFMRSIQGQIIFWGLILALVPALIVGGVAYTTARAALRDAVQDNLLAVAEIKAQRVEGRLDRWISITRIIASLPSVAGRPGEENTSGISLLANGARGVPGYDNTVDDINRTLRDFESEFPAIAVSYLLSTDGIVLAVTNTDLFTVGEDVSHRLFFQEGLSGVHIGDIRVNRANEEQLLYSVSYPVQTGDGRVIGVAGLQVNTDALEDIMADGTPAGASSALFLGTTGESYIVNQTNEQYGQVMLTRSRFSDADTRLIQEVETFATEQVFGGAPGEVVLGAGDYQDYRGKSVVGAWRYIPALRWAVIAEIDTGEAYAAVDNLALVVAVVVGVAALVAGVITYLVARSIAQPVTQLAGAASRLANGALSERVQVKARNEVGLLAESFNSMAANLEEMVEAERQSKAELETTVSDYVTFVEQVSAGNLKARLSVRNGHNGSGHNGSSAHQDDDTDDDMNRLGANLNSMVANLAEMAAQIRQVAQSVTSAATEIQAAATQQTASATEQDAAVTQTVATVEEVRTTVVQTAERAQTVADASQQSVTVSVTGQRAVEETMQGMDLIRQRVESIAETILMLSERTQQIGEIIDTVNALADQSKLLALNASIEAARAGEEGKGFAVVAMEVRQLAEESRNATARVRDILNEIQQATNTAVMVTEEGSKGAESGLDLVQRAGESIRELAGTIEEAAQSATQIAASTHQQTNGMDQLVSAMMQIKQSSTQTASTMKQTEQSVRDLLALARQLEAAAARYEI